VCFSGQTDRGGLAGMQWSSERRVPLHVSSRLRRWAPAFEAHTQQPSQLSPKSSIQKGLL